ncbi:hypothetical protein [Pseudomonas fluorescens]|uniref:Uncharacterized protein n=1 Tax=Pseudomonas fluorescens TaxID=294 RepID=A0A5E7AJV9_PSEFL|nr:hypothetical protein [Pseudomonas fluorescens]VVN79336.1 hypothetical protein PS691_00962 [Pseudomonas fluorescens]
MTQLRQAFYEKLLELEELGVERFKGATLYVNPINEFGEDVILRNKYGQVVHKLFSHGPYRSSAEEFKI